MKYPNLRSEWVPVENPDGKGITHQTMKVYANDELVLEKQYDMFQTSAEYFIPVWDKRGRLLTEPTEVKVTVQAVSENFSSDIIESPIISLSGIGIDNPSNLSVSMMAFPEFFEEVEEELMPDRSV